MTIDIQTIQGDLFQYDPSNEFIYKNGAVTSRSEYEPVFMNHIDPNIPPSLSGIYIVKLNKVISLSGMINPLIDINQIDL